MSLLKLLFDLPEAGGESNFTVEEQEELMAFEHNLDEHLVENFALPPSDDASALLHGPGATVVDGPVDLIANGHADVAMANGVEETGGLLDSLRNGHMFCSSTIEHVAQPIGDEVGPVQSNAVLEFAPAVGIPESTPVVDSASASVPAIAPVEPAAGSVQEIAPTRKYDISSKHQGTGKSVWIKWRGKWQAAIQVRVEDCRAATVKAMPAYGKKEYVPIYVVTIRSYIWIDAHNVCDINQKPEPLLSGTHDEWRHRVVDTGAPRRRTFLSLGWEMLDISDRLHIMGVVRRARFVSVWKEFAQEASAASKYSELGSLLVRIHAVVEPDYVRQSWVDKRLKAWVDECLKAETAATIEKLIKECIRVILWDKAAKLWEAPEQPVLDPGWADWKGPAFDELMDPNDAVVVPADKQSRPTSSSLTPKAEAEGSIVPKRGRPRKSEEESDRQQPVSSAGRVTTRKQVKVEKHYDAGPSSSSAMERFSAASEPVGHCSQTAAFSVDASKSQFAVDHTLETKVVATDLQSTGQGSGVKVSQDGPLNSASKTWKWKFKSDAWGCSAFLKNKKRRCPRQAWKGIYCEKHQGLVENPSADPNVEPSHLCMARYWVENRRCANSVVEGSYYCLMHADCRPPKSVDSGVLNDAKEDLEGGSDKVIKLLRCTGVTEQDTQLSSMMKDGQNHPSKLADQDPGQGEQFSLVTPVNGDGAGVNFEQLGIQLLGRPTEKLLNPGSSNGSGGFKNSGDSISDNNLSRLVADMGVKDKRSFLKAGDLLCKYMNVGLSKGKGGHDEAQSTKMIDFIIDETTKDLPSGDMLLKIITAEKARLARMVLEDGSSSRKTSDTDFLRGIGLPGFQSGSTLKPEAGVLSNETSASQSTSFVQDEGKDAGPDTRYQCCLCGHKFEQLSVLGKHWKEQHKREAQLFEKCLLCRICDKSGPIFKSKLGVVRHWRAVHTTLPMSSPGWSVCVMCDKQCLDFDHLWQHVEDLHHNQWSSTDFAGRVKASLLSRNGHKCSICSETFSTNWEVQQHKETRHRGHELLHSGTKRNRDAMGSEVIGNDSKRIEDDDTYKFSCRYCSMRFQLLPDLGRHHQAEHKEHSDGRARAQSLSGGMPSMQRRKTNQEESGRDWHALAAGRGEGTDKDGNATKWRYRARSKSKSSSRKRSVPMKKQSGGAEAILQRMRAVKQVLEDQKTKRPPRKRDRKAERARRLARLAGSSGTPAPIATKLKCRFCGLEFALLPDLGRHHQAEHSAVKQAFIINGRNEVQSGVYTLTKEGIIGPVQAELLNRPPNSRELLEVARSTCCKEWLYKELGKRYSELSPRLFVQAAHLCSEAKLEIRWHQDKYVCPDGCKSYDASSTSSSLELDLVAFVKSSSNIFSGDGKDHASNFLSSSNNAICKNVLISEDLSNGLEKVPIRCVMDGDEMEPCTCSLCMECGSSTTPGGGQPWNNFVYITKRHLDPSLGLDTKSSQVRCSCTGDKCSASSCDHVSMFDTDNADACTIDGKSIRGEFAYDEFGRIILDVGYMVYECNSSCQCEDTCQNRVLQKGVHLKLEVFKSRHKGWGVRAAEAISRGTFVCEYIGEILNDSEANERGKRYDQVGCSYLYDIDAHLDVIGPRSSSRPFVIDATRYGNVARFINHSCDPNLMNYEVLVESMDCQLAHIGFFAKRDIAIGEELAYDYRYKLLPGKGCPCHCGAPNCRGRLY